MAQNPFSDPNYGESLVGSPSKQKNPFLDPDYQQPDTTPNWGTEQGAAPARQGLDMPAPQFDTSGLSLDQRTPSQHMGIDPTAGPLSNAAAMAVDSGAHADMLDAWAGQVAEKSAPTPATPEPVAKKESVPAAPAPQGREVSRDIGVHKEGMSEPRANQVRSELARKNPGVVYTVEEDPSLKNGYVVVGRANNPSFSLDGTGGKMSSDSNARNVDPQRLADQSTATALNDTLVRYGLGQDWSDAYEAVKLPDALSGVRDALQAAFGRDVRPVAPTAAKFDIFNGVYIPNQPNAVYVNVKSTTGFVNIAGHELWHAIKRQRPELIDWYRKNSRQFYKDLPAYRDRLNALVQPGEKKYDNSKAEEELEADFMGDSLTDPAFLQQLADASPTKFRALLAQVRLWLAGVANRIKGLGSSKEVTDVKALQGYLKEVLVAFAEGKDIPAAPKSIAPNFSRTAGDQTQTENFKRWFAGSKVVNAEGKPLVVYHGTNADFGAFDPKLTRDVGMHFGTADQAGRFGNRVIPVYLSIKNPFRLPDAFSRLGGPQKAWNEIHCETDIEAKESDDLLSLARTVDEKWNDDRDANNTEIPEAKKFWKLAKKVIARSGYDGIVYSNDVEGKGDSYIAFRPEQIKSAIGNNGNFDPNDDRLNALLQEGEQAYSDTKAEEELEADFMGDSLADPAFLQQLADASPSKFRALLTHVRLWLAGVASKLKGLGASKEVTDVKALQGYLKEVLVAFAEGKRGHQEGADGCVL